MLPDSGRPHFTGPLPPKEKGGSHAGGMIYSFQIPRLASMGIDLGPAPPQPVRDRAGRPRRVPLPGTGPFSLTPTKCSCVPPAVAPTGTERFTWETYIMTSEHESLTPREELLCRLFAEVLKRREVSVDEGFFALGGDSISAVGLVGLAREAGLEFTRRELFQNPSPAELAAVAREVAPPAEVTADSTAPGATAGTTPGFVTEDAPLISLSQAELDEIERQIG